MTNRTNDRAANVNTLLISVIGVLLAVVGYFAKNSFETINEKLDAHTSAQMEIQTDVTTIKAQLPALTQRVDKLESSQHDIWQHFGGQNDKGTKP
jgi:peptidoglycan hydrolase CwlO-like protein